MARIELNLPDDLLHQVDRYARRLENSRDDFLRRVVEEEIERCHARLRKEIEDLRASHPPLDLGGKTAAELIREGRDSR
jgi:metal-responsive CopG/Arc/MetJ family transcriptional regulator